MIKCLFLDIGGVLLSDGWGHSVRRKAAQTFHLKWSEMQRRHQLTFETFENGNISFKEYLDRVVFYEKRTWTRAEFQNFIFSQTNPDLRMIRLIRELREKYRLKVVVVSNEGRELNQYRISRYEITDFVDAFISSCFVHIRKPNIEIYKIALDLAQVPASQILYIENTAMFVEVAKTLGIPGLIHTDYATTRTKLASLGLSLDHSRGKKDLPETRNWTWKPSP